MKKLLASILVSLFGLIGARGQSVSITPSSTTYQSTGGVMNFTVNAVYPGNVTAVAISVGVVPTQWTYAGTGSPSPDNVPSLGSAGPFNFSYNTNTIPFGQSVFTFSVNYPSGLSGTQTFSNIVLAYTISGGGTQFVAGTPVSIAAPGFAPSVVTQPTSLTVTQNTQAFFSVAGNGSPAPSYQWRLNGSPIANATNFQLIIPSAQPTDAGNYDVVLSNSFGSVTSSIATLTVNSPPAVTTQPISTTVAQGQSATFAVTATGTPTPTYQWYRNGSPIDSTATGNPSAATAVLTISNASVADAGTYYVVVTTIPNIPTLSVTSATATLTVNIPPAIAVAPQSVTTTLGGTAVFTVVPTASSTQPLTYQWRKNGIAIFGETNATLTRSNVTIADAATYDVQIVNQVGVVTSPLALLTINTLPVIVTPPIDAVGTVGGQVSFTVSAVSSVPLSYQWRKNGNNIGGAVFSTLTLTNLSLADVASYDVLVINNVGTVTSSPAALSVVTFPSIAVQPSPVSVTTGASATFSVTAGGAGPFTYQWSKNGQVILGATLSAYTLASTSATDAGAYGVTVSNAAGSVSSNSAALQVNSAPVITVQPSPLQVVNQGQTATLAVSAIGSPTPTYQWRQGGQPIANATNATLTLSGVTGANSGNYDVVVSNLVGSVDSTATLVTVNVAPTITGSPASFSAVLNASATFTVTATGTGPISYQWLKNGSPVSGNPTAFSSTLSFTSVQAGDVGTYSVTVSNPYGSQTSAGAALSVTSTTFGPVITSQPVSQTVPETTSVSFTVVAAGNPVPSTFTYQWRKGGVPLADGATGNGSSIFGSTSGPTLTIVSAFLADAGNFDCVITSTGGSVTSSVAVLSITKAPAFTTQPIGTTTNAGSSYTLTSAAVGGPAPAYQWFKDGSLVAGATGASLVLNPIAGSQAGNYTVTATNNSGTATSAVANVVVNFTPVITSQPTPAASVNLGQPYTFSVTATGYPVPTYQWTQVGVGDVPGATNSTYTIFPTINTSGGNYTVTVRNTNGFATSNLAALTVVTPPVISTNPTGGTVNPGQSLVMTVSATGTAPFTYQWQKNGANIPGAVAASYTVTSATGDNTGLYTVLVSNAAGAVASAATSVVVNTVPVVTTPPASQTANTGDSVTFSVVATGTPTLIYQWSKNGVNIDNATFPIYTIGSVQKSDSGLYRVAVSNGFGTVVTSFASLAINDQLPLITTQPVGTTGTIGVAYTLTVAASGTPTLTYQWFKGTTAISGATNTQLTLGGAASDTGTYTVVVSNPAGKVTSSPAVVNFTNVGPSITTQPVGFTGTIGTAYTISVVATGTPTPTYQWVKGTANITGATSARLALTGLATDSGSYTVVVTNSVGAVTSNAAVVQYNAVAPVITTQPVGTTGTIGTPYTLRVVATGIPAPTYQWIKDGANVGGATLAQLALTGVAAENGSYTVAVTNSAATVVSSSAAVLFKPAVALPVIVVQPSSRTLAVGATTLLTVQATGQGPLLYQWFKAGVTVSGATTNQLSLTNVATTAAGVYTVTITNDGGTVTSASATLTVNNNNVAPSITSQPAPQIVLAGGTATFAVVAIGNPAPSYQWRKNGTNLAGATNATFSITTAAASDAGGYDVVITNAGGQAISSLADLTVTALAAAPVIIRQPSDARVVAGLNASFTVVATGAPSLAYQWRYNGAAISGATNATYSLTGVSSSQSGQYSVVVSNTVGTVTSSAGTLTVLARSYAGAWFGTLGSNGIFAMVVNDDNTGAFLGYTAGTRTGYVSRGVRVDDSGNVSFTVTTTAGVAADAAPASDAGDVPMTAAAIDDLTFQASIGSSGVLAGASSTSIAINAVRADSSGSSAPYVGFFQASAAGSDAQVLVIAGPAGQAFAMLQNAGVVDAGVGTIDANGRIGVTTAGSLNVTGSIVPDTGTVAVTVLDTKNVATSYAGFAAGSAGLGNQRLFNISTRTSAGVADQSAIVGFVVTGTESKTLLIRAIGPTLGGFGVANTLAAPRLDLIRSGTTLATNIGWTTAPNTAEIVAAAARSGAFPLGATSADSVILTTLPPGNYSAQCSANDGKVGIALVEVYDLSGGSTAQKLANISCRAVAGTGDNTLIAGVFVSGSAPKRVLIRAAGPALTQFGVQGALQRPLLQLFDNNKAIVATNSGWSSTTDVAAVTEAFTRVGAFAFANGSADAAIVVNLQPGAYSAQVTGVGGTTGITLVEIYELP